MRTERQSLLSLCSDYQRLREHGECHFQNQAAFLRTGRGCGAARGLNRIAPVSAAPKSEGRSPKPERRPRSEIRSAGPVVRSAQRSLPSSNHLRFGLRASAFFRVSAFGLRVCRGFFAAYLVTRSSPVYITRSGPADRISIS
jgi:hypothetical protein